MDKSETQQLVLDHAHYPPELIKAVAENFFGEIDPNPEIGRTILKSSSYETCLDFANHLLVQRQNSNMGSGAKSLEASNAVIDRGILPFGHHRLRSGRVLVSSYFGDWAILPMQDFLELESGKIQSNSELCQTLIDIGVIVTPENVDRLARTYANLHLNLFLRPSLHIINTTTACNYRCKYCHAGVSQGGAKMDAETARKVSMFIMANSDKALTIEFQGGEALLNIEAVREVISTVENLNLGIRKDVRFTIVSNLSLLNEEILDYLLDHKVSLCTSLDGPEEIHDSSRKQINGGGTYQQTVSKIAWAKEHSKARGINFDIGLLCTVTAKGLKAPNAVVDSYLDLGVNMIHLRPLNYLGDAVEAWDGLGYTAEEFARFWTAAMDHILEENLKGRLLIERGALFILTKILGKTDPLYTELMSPCGAGRGQVLYNPDGQIYTCDEARMLGEDLFKIGNVEVPGAEVLSCENSVQTWMASMLDLTCGNCAFRPWCGTCPVVNYQTRKSLVPSITESFWHKVYHAQFRYLFEKIDTSPAILEIFKKWISLGAL